jgi:hypothetical protein
MYKHYPIKHFGGFIIFIDRAMIEFQKHLLINHGNTSIVTINRHDVGHVLKEHNIIAEGTQGFLLTNQKMMALTGMMTMILPTRLPMKMKFCDEFAR